MPIRPEPILELDCLEHIFISTLDEKGVLLYKQLRNTQAQLQDEMVLSQKRKMFKDGNIILLLEYRGILHFE